MWDFLLAHIERIRVCNRSTCNKPVTQFSPHSLTSPGFSNNKFLVIVFHCTGIMVSKVAQVSTSCLCTSSMWSAKASASFSSSVSASLSSPSSTSATNPLPKHASIPLKKDANCISYSRSISKSSSRYKPRGAARAIAWLIFTHTDKKDIKRI